EIEWHYIAPGKPTQNAFIPLAGRREVQHDAFLVSLDVEIARNELRALVDADRTAGFSNDLGTPRGCGRCRS
ncbi:MAG: hypothetical protein E6447_09865, partial [Bradyrhizobium sp.]|nr:hypothetical protein [Bradyrhizobium sp.]